MNEKCNYSSCKRQLCNQEHNQAACCFLHLYHAAVKFSNLNGQMVVISVLIQMVGLD